MLVIADGFRRLILLFLPWFHFLISGKLTGIDLVQIWIALVPKGTGSVPQSMGKRNWSRSKRNWEIPISDQNRSAFILDCLKYFHHLILHLLKSKTKLHNQHNNKIILKILLNFSTLELKKFSISWYSAQRYYSSLFYEICIESFGIFWISNTLLISYDFFVILKY